MLVEITNQGLFLPTRMDIIPYILSPFSTHIKYPNQSTDALKIILLIYWLYVLFATLR